MKYQTSGSFRQAVEQRLVAQSQRTGEGLARLRKKVTFDRFLAHLFAASSARWMVKGGVALDLRLRHRARMTLDLDLALTDRDTVVMREFQAAETVDLGDYFDFTVERSLTVNRDEEAGAVRYHVRAALDGRLFESFVVDVIMEEPDQPLDMIEGPDLLGFAGIPPIRVPTVSLAQHVAEKLHAYTQRYGLDARPSSRVKDLVDLVLVAENFVLVSGEMAAALRLTFDRRSSQMLPQSVPEPPTEWRQPYLRLATPLGLSPSLSGAHQLVSEMLDPVLAGRTSESLTWDPSTKCWK